MTAQAVSEELTIVRRLGNGRSPDDVYIGRPTEWGNPFIIGKDGSREDVIRKHADWLLKNPELIEKARRELKGKTLRCFCAPAACHGDILARIANGERP